MGSWDVGEAVDKINDYKRILKIHNYHKNGDGEKPWSFKFEHENGTSIEINDTGWTKYTNERKVWATGNGPRSLESYLLNNMTKYDIIELIMFRGGMK